jgi:hypothetical protein
MTPTAKLQGTPHPYAVSAALTHVPLRVVSAVEELYDFYALLMSYVRRRHLPPNMLRVAGGCSGMHEDTGIVALDYLVDGLQEYRGLLSSGGTREAKDGRVRLMITDVLQLMVEQAGDRVVTLGTLPRVDTLRLVEHSRLVLDDSATAPQPGVHQLVIVQPRGSERHLGWDGDVVAYLDMMSRYMLVRSSFARQARPMLLALEGGNIVRQEIVLAARRGFPVILSRGYGRETDKIADDLQHNKPITCRVNGDTLYLTPEERERLTVVEAGDVPELRKAIRAISL